MTAGCKSRSQDAVARLHRRTEAHIGDRGAVVVGPQRSIRMVDRITGLDSSPAGPHLWSDRVAVGLVRHRAAAATMSLRLAATPALRVVVDGEYRGTRPVGIQRHRVNVVREHSVELTE
jgi:hypothetical protein